jgi:hypothetical protein
MLTSRTLTGLLETNNKYTVWGSINTQTPNGDITIFLKFNT